MNPHLNQERVEFLRTRSAGAPRERLSQWPRDEKMLPVVELDVNWVRFSTLNHRTTGERLKLCRDRHDPHLFDGDPMGSAAQAGQFELLRSHRGFEDLKLDLRERGQQEPSVVTAEGVLINGNRRTAAFRELLHDNYLKARYVRCIVLPEDASTDEVRLLETELQVSERFEEEYSWINRGFLIRELLAEHGNNFEAVAKLMRMTSRRVQDEFRKFCQIDQLVALSGGVYMHVDFEPNESAFEELAKHIANKPQEEANAVRNTYFLGTLAGCKYRDLRNLRRSDASVYVEHEIQALPVLQSILALPASKNQTASDVDLLLGEALGPDGEARSLDRLLTLVAKSRRNESLTAADGSSIATDALLQQINTAVTRAAKEAEADAQDEEQIQAPTKYLSDAYDRVRWAQKALAEARALPNWAEEEYQAALQQLRQGVTDLENV